MNTSYSFLDTHAAIVGPGGSFSIGAGAGIAEEGITLEPAGDINAMTIGADGTGMHTLIADKSGHVSVRLLKTSPVNALLGAMLAFQRTSAKNHGQNTITIANTVSGDTHTCQQVAFAKVPVVTYAKNASMNEWRFDAVTIDIGFGRGV
jgi:hypothetical protein